MTVPAHPNQCCDCNDGKDQFNKAWQGATIKMLLVDDFQRHMSGEIADQPLMIGDFDLIMFFIQILVNSWQGK
jgi:hypothetical protein